MARTQGPHGNIRRAGMGSLPLGQYHTVLIGGRCRDGDFSEIGLFEESSLDARLRLPTSVVATRDVKQLIKDVRALNTDAAPFGDDPLDWDLLVELMTAWYYDNVAPKAKPADELRGTISSFRGACAGLGST
jgi:hypothetical protein